MAKGNGVATVPAVPSPVTQMEATIEQAIREMMPEDSTGDEIFMSIINAETADGILSGGSGGAIGLKSVIGKPFTLNRAELRKSDLEAGMPAYVVMFATFDDGTDAVITTGAQNVLAQVISLHQKGFLPYRVSSAVSAKPTKEGYFPISLTKAPDIEEQF